MFSYVAEGLTSQGHCSLLTCSVRSLKPSLLHRVVGKETQEHFVGAGDDRRRLFGATKASQSRGAIVSSVINLQMIISALQMSLHVDLIKNLEMVLS